jgi:hypothetical protein
MAVRRLQRMAGTILCSGAPVAGLLLGWTGTTTLCAQTPTGGPAPSVVSAPSAQSQRIYWKRSEIKLPIQINDQFRSMIKEVQLYVKDQPTAAWQMRGKLDGTQKFFTFKAPADGEYAFTMVTVDKNGHAIPADVRNEPPGLIVMFDTQRPQIELTNLGTCPEGQLIEFVVHDPNLNQARTQLQFQCMDKQYRPLSENVPGRPNVYCVPGTANFTGMIRASAEDLAGNIAVIEESVHRLRVQTTSASSTRTEPNVTIPTKPIELSPNLLAKTSPVDIQPIPGSTAPIILPSERFSGEPRGSEPRTVTESPSIVRTSSLDTAKVQLVNQTKVFLDYQVENVKASGISKVEVWLTRDQGKTWRKHCEQGHGKSPVEVQLPDEGKYGITLVATNKQGDSSAAPVGGDVPDWTIEVDTTKPASEITSVKVERDGGTPVVHISWTAQDKNFSDGPVELSYSATDRGPWLQIGKNLPADGHHRWTPPAGIGGHAFIRVVARDKAGNDSVCVTRDCIHFEALPRPVINGIRTQD